MILIALSFVAGIWLLQHQVALPSLYWLPAIVAGFGLYSFCIRIKLPEYLRLMTLALTVFAVGFFYAASFATLRMNDALQLSWQQKNIEVIGVVATMSEVNHRGERFRFDVEQVLTPDAQVPSRIDLSYYHGSQWHQTKEKINESLNPATFKAGERWQLTVKLKRPHATYNPHGYDFEAWALAQNIRAMGSVRHKSGMQKLSNFVWRPSYMVEFCREKVGNRINRVLGNQAYAGVIRGLVIGEDSQISSKDWDVYLRTGTNHLMSISGLHITMLSGLVFTAFSFLWRRNARLVLRTPTRRAATIGGGAVAILYACLAGLSVPTQRTLYMLMTFAVALLLNRRVPMSRVLALALMVVVLLDPWAVLAPGFWLSFSAVAVIAYATVNRLSIRHWLLEAINTQWTVTLGLLPFLIMMFGQASIVSPIANALAIPVISLLVVPLAILGALLPIDFILQISQAILSGCMVGLNWLANTSFATWQQAVAPAWTIALAVLGVLWLLLPRGIPERWLGVVLMMPMLCVSPSQLAEGQMKVTVLDVGQGLSVVVQTARHAMVYDTGRRYNHESDAGEKIIVPYLRSQGIQKLDALVVSHDDDDHRGGAISILSQIQTKWLAASFDVPPIAATRQFKCYAGQTWHWDTVKFEVLSPSIESYQNEGISDNDRSCVIKVSSQHGSILLTGDIEKEVEKGLVALQKNKLASDVMVAPHHGSHTSSNVSFVSAVSARHVIFSVGYLNRFKHPKPAIVGRFLLQGAEVYRSDYHGAVTIDFIHNSKLSITAERVVNKKYWHDEFL